MTRLPYYFNITFGSAKEWLHYMNEICTKDIFIGEVKLTINGLLV